MGARAGQPDPSGAGRYGLSDEQQRLAGREGPLDTSVVIAYLDRQDQTNAVAVGVVDGLVRSRRNPGLISMVTVTEVLVGLARSGDRELYAEIVELRTQLPGFRRSTF